MNDDDQSHRSANLGVLRELAADLAKLAATQGMAPAKIRIAVARGLSARDVEDWADFDVYGQPHIVAQREALIARWDQQRSEVLRQSLGRR